MEQGKYYNHVGRTYLAKADMPACIWAPGNEPEVQPAVKPHHTFLRQAVPQAGAGPERSVPFSVVYEESGDISDEYQNGLRWMNYDDGTYSGTRTFTEKHGNPVTRNNFSGTLPLNAWTRTAPDLISGVLEGRGLDLPAGFDCTFDNATRHYWGETRYAKKGQKPEQPIHARPRPSESTRFRASTAGDWARSAPDAMPETRRSAAGEPPTSGAEFIYYSYFPKRSERRSTLTESMG